MKKYVKTVSVIAALTLFASLAASCVKNDPPPAEERPEYKAGVIDTLYETEEVMIADYVIDEKSGADPTGKKDSTDAIQSVLDACSAAGGGTVFLPYGQYVVSKQILVPSFVYLTGDYNDPDKSGFDGEYGTVINAKVKSAETEVRSSVLADRDDVYANFPALFRIGGSAGLIGVTIYYPKQNIDSVTPYPFAVEIPSFAGDGGHINHHASTVKNVTFVNCYKGIIAGASASVFSNGFGAAFEQVHIENVKGTFLYQAMQLYIASEAGTVKDVTIANRYWKESLLGKADAAKLDEYTLNYTTGLLLGDLEWLFFDNISVSDVCMGVRIYDGIRRFFTNEVYFIGQFVNLNVRNTKTALRIDNMYPNFGITVADSYLEGTIYSINERDNTTSSLKLVNTELSGDTYGNSLYRSGIDSHYSELKASNKIASLVRPDEYKFSNTVFDAAKDYNADNTGAKDASAEIQKALDAARDAGGGIVYLKAGYYRLDSVLTVYEKTELRGSASASTRDQIGLSKGTVLFGNCGYSADKLLAENAQALITLIGDNSGVSGLRIIYFDNKPAPRDPVKYRYHSYALRILGDGCSASRLSIVGVPFGIDVNGASDCVIREVSGTFYDIGINVVNSNNVYVDELLENAAVVSRIGYSSVPSVQNYFLLGWPSDGNGLQFMYSEITRPNLVLVKAVNSDNVSVLNTSAFGIKTFYYGVNSNAKILSCNSDNCSDYIWYVDGGTLYAVNMLKYNDKDTYKVVNNGKLTCFNVLTLHFTTNFSLDNDVFENVPASSVNIPSSGKDVNDLPSRYTK